MVTVVKSLLIADAGQSGPAEFLGSANRAIRRMELQRMAMALCMARFDGRRLTVASAGMPPVLVHRGGGNGSAGAGWRSRRSPCPACLSAAWTRPTGRALSSSLRATRCC